MEQLFPIPEKTHMSPNTKDLVEEFSLHVITSTDVENALNKIFRFFKKYFPLDFMNMPIYDAHEGRLHYKAIVNDDGVMLVDEKVKLSDVAQKEALELVGRKISNVENTSRDPITIEVANHFAIKDIGSTLIIQTKLRGNRFGVIGLVAWGERRYTEKHIQFMENLFEPIAGSIRHLLSQLEITNQKERLITENQELKKRLGYRIIGAESGLKEVMLHVERVARLDIPVLLTGETGVGKEIIANAIHLRSKRSDGPLVSFNCGAIPDTLLESELFGYEKGAFTGADSMKRGYFEQADGGTVFMDEIGELSANAQVKLLRFLQTMEFRRVGGSRPISIDVRTVSATNRDLETMVKNQQYRKDLWYRLNVFPIQIPPLRERKEDIPDLAEYFARRQSVEMNLPYHHSLAPEAIEQLKAYDWPGNVRELQNVIERALILSRGEPLCFANLSALSGNLSDEVSAEDAAKFPTMEEMMSLHIKKSLNLSKGRIEGNGGAAELLGMNPSTLRAKMRKLRIKINRMPV
jgi:transcriptional regulator with GAF, ATPase, and Fis domain